MRLSSVTPPATLPLTLAEVKLHLRVDGAEEDALLFAMIRAATSYLDGANGTLGRSLITQSWRLTLDAFPCMQIDVPLPPLRTIDSITYLDGAGMVQTLAPTAYQVALGAPGAGMVFRTRSMPTWPLTLQHPEAVRVNFTAGYGALGSDIPEPIRLALLMRVADLYAHREGQMERSLSSNAAMDALLWSYRQMGF